jgi:hypothetical protein
MAKAKPTRAMSLIILFLPYKNTAGAAMSEKQSGCGVVPDFGGFPENYERGTHSPARRLRDGEAQQSHRYTQSIRRH